MGAPTNMSQHFTTHRPKAINEFERLRPNRAQCFLFDKLEIVAQCLTVSIHIFPFNESSKFQFTAISVNPIQKKLPPSGGSLSFEVNQAKSWPVTYFLAGVFSSTAPITSRITISGSM